MGTIVKFDRNARGAEWALEKLAEHAASKARIMGFAFEITDGGAPTSAIMPDELQLKDLLMARAILDETISELMKNNRE
jgi:hypothetical protein